MVTDGRVLRLIGAAPELARERDGRRRPAADGAAAGRPSELAARLAARRGRRRGGRGDLRGAAPSRRSTDDRGHAGRGGTLRDLGGRQSLVLGRESLRPPRPDDLQPGRPLVNGPPEAADRRPSPACSDRRPATWTPRPASRTPRSATSTPRATTCCRSCSPQRASCSASTACSRRTSSSPRSALFVLFGLARRIVGPVWALVVMTALAVSLPMLYVARDTLSEPLALLYLLGGRAVAAPRHRLTGGCATSRWPASWRRPRRWCASMPTSPCWRWSSSRRSCSLRAPAGHRARGRAAGRRAAGGRGRAGLDRLGRCRLARRTATTTTSGRTSCSDRGRRGAARPRRGGRRDLLASVRPRLAGRRATRYAAAIALRSWLVAAFAFLASRPLWLVAHGGGLDLYLEQVQRQAGDPIDIARTYAEQSVSWQALYFGWPTVVLAVGGYVLLLRRFLRERDYALLGLLTMGLSLSALYLWAPEITPDQVYAARRYVPVIMPALLIAAAYALRFVFGALRPARTGDRDRSARLAMIALPGGGHRARRSRCARRCRSWPGQRDLRRGRPDRAPSSNSTRARSTATSRRSGRTATCHRSGCRRGGAPELAEVRAAARAHGQDAVRAVDHDARHRLTRTGASRRSRSRACGRLGGRARCTRRRSARSSRSSPSTSDRSMRTGRCASSSERRRDVFLLDAPVAPGRVGIGDQHHRAADRHRGEQRVDPVGRARPRSVEEHARARREAERGRAIAAAAVSSARVTPSDAPGRTGRPGTAPWPRCRAADGRRRRNRRRRPAARPPKPRVIDAGLTTKTSARRRRR